MTERLRVREIDDDEARRLVRIIRRRRGSVVTLRRARDQLRGMCGYRGGRVVAKPEDELPWVGGSSPYRL